MSTRGYWAATSGLCVQFSVLLLAGLTSLAGVHSQGCDVIAKLDGRGDIVLQDGTTTCIQCFVRDEIVTNGVQWAVGDALGVVLNTSPLDGRHVEAGQLVISDATAFTGGPGMVVSVICSAMGEQLKEDVHLEDGVTVELSSSVFSVEEGSLFVNLEIVKDKRTTQDIILSIELTGLTAKGGVDFGPFPSNVLLLNVLFPANDTLVNYVVSVNDDQIVEDTETFHVRLVSDDSHVTIGSVSNATVSILDDDMISFILQTGDRVVEESDSQITFSITKVGVANRNVSIVLITNDGSASAPGDYVSVLINLTFTPEDITKEFSVIVNDDNRVEDMERFYLTFEPALGETGVKVSDDMTVITILDDSDVVEVRLVSTGSSTILEGLQREVTIVSTGNNDIPVSLSVEISEVSTAVEGLDFTLNFSNQTLTLEPEATSLLLSVVTIDDGLYEGDTETLTLTITKETRVMISADSSQLSIDIIDVNTIEVGFITETGDITVVESLSYLNITIGLVGGVLGAPVTVNITAVSNLAVIDEDFMFEPVEVTFEPGLPTTSVVSVSIFDDTIFEGREGFSLSLSTNADRVSFNPQVLEIIIADNEDLLVSFSSSSYSVSETDKVLLVNVELNDVVELQRNISLSLRSRDGASPTGATGGLDFVVVSMTMTFGPTIKRNTFSVMLLDDEISEGLESFILQVVVEDMSIGELGVLVEASVTILDNEDIFVSLSSAVYTVKEGVTFVVVIIEKSGVTPNNEQTEVLLTITSGTADGSSDYKLFPTLDSSVNFTAVLEPDNVQSPFGIAIADDAIVEGDEYFTISLSLIDSRSKQQGGVIFLGNITMATVFIEDNDKIKVSLVPMSSLTDNKVTVQEGNTQLNFTIKREDSVSLATAVRLTAQTIAITAGSDDYRAIEMVFEFQPESGKNKETQEVSFSLSLLDDDIAEGTEVFSVELQASDTNAVFSVRAIQVAIEDDDVAVIEFVNSTYNVFEMEASVNVCLQKSVQTAFSFIVGVQPFESIHVPEGIFRARANVDFNAAVQNITFEPDTVIACLSISILQDGMPGEGAEVFSIKFSLPAGESTLIKGSHATADVVVTDVADVVVGFLSVDDVRVGEDIGTVELCVVVLNPPPTEGLGTNVDIEIMAIDGTANDMNYHLNEQDLLVVTLNDSLRVQCFTIQIIDNEIFDNGAERYFTVSIVSVTLSNSNLRVAVSKRNVTVSISEDDEQVYVVGFDNTRVDVPEQFDSVELCVSIIHPLVLDIQLRLQLVIDTQPGTAEQGSDFVGVANRTVGFLESGNQQVCFQVEILDDELDDNGESFSVHLSVLVMRGDLVSLRIDPSVAYVTINDSPGNTTLPPAVATIGFEQTNYSVEEGAGSIEVVVLLLNGQLARPVVVMVTTMDNTAQDPDDYASVASTMTFISPSSERGTISIPIMDDLIDDDNESFFVSLSIGPADVGSVQLSPERTEVNILDNDAVCQDLPDLENGMIRYSSDESPRAVGTVASHTCNPGYVLSGVENRTCQDDTEFDGSPPSCEPIICNELAVLENGVIQYSPDDIGPEYDLNTVATYICNDGFKLVGDTSRTCMDVDAEVMGQFNGSTPICEPIICNELETLENGEIEYSPDNAGPEYDLNTLATYVCDEGFELVGDTFRTCTNVDASVMGQFNGSAPTCESIICNELEALENGEIEYSPDDVGPEYDLDTVATYDCDEGFQLVGDTFRTCMDIDAGIIGQFDGSAPTCESITCEDLPDIANGMVSYSTTELPHPIGSNATYTCEDGFMLVGSSERTCLSNGNFSGMEPFCSMIPVCQDLPDLENGMIRYSSDESPRAVGTVASHTCIPGYVLSGVENRTCQDDTEFDGSPPSCEPIICNELEALENGGIEYSPDDAGPEYDLNTVATYICNNGYNLFGNTSRTCMDVDDGVMGRFNGSAPNCEVPQVNDTIVGDPLFSFPLTNSNFNDFGLDEDGPPSLCFEIHGEANTYFNLVTDNCVSVNARYTALNEYWNVINGIAVRAVDNDGQCRNILVDIDGCSASVDSIPVTSFRSAGVYVRPSRKHVRVSVPNCNGSSHLVMYVLCQQNMTVFDPFTDAPFQASMIKYVITHGVNLNDNSHGLLGQFWNVPITITEYTGPVRDDTQTNRYEIRVSHPDFSGERRFTGVLADSDWEFKRTPCFYVGNQQGGPIYEVEDPNDSVIEGQYAEYEIDGAFETEYKYSRFDSFRCMNSDS